MKYYVKSSYDEEYFRSWVKRNWGVFPDKLSDSEYDSAYRNFQYHINGGDIDLEDALDYMYGTDRDPDITSYTEEDKQRAIDYYMKWMDKEDAWREKTFPSDSGDYVRSSNDSDDYVDISDYEFIENRGGYHIYRKIIDDGNGKIHGEWAAQDQDQKHPPFKITYMQARGHDVIDKYDSDVKKLSRELGRMLLPNSSSRYSGRQSVSSSYKRVARYGEFDNGHVFFDYDEMDDDTAEEKARQASLNDPNDIYYVKYDDVMNPDSDNRWYRGNKYNWSDITYRNGRYQPVESSEDPEFDEYEDDIKEIGQEFTSENTSINSTKLPALFKLVSFEPGTVNIDYGGGKFDNVADYLSQYDVINLVYDPYNRSKEHNQEVIKTIKEHGGADTATCSNVLNVIKEPEVRKNVLENIKKLVKPSGTIYLTVYEGTGKGDEGPTKSGYQLNRKTSDYIEEIQEVFPDATRKGKLIVAHPSGSANSSVDITSASYGGAYDIEDDMFFTRDDINEFAFDAVDELNSIYVDKNFDVSDVYMLDPNRLNVEFTDGENEYFTSVHIDMRRIRRPRDINKYIDNVVNQVIEQEQDYEDVMFASQDINADTYSTGGGFGQPSKSNRSQRVPEPSLDPPDYPDPEELYDRTEIVEPFDLDVEIMPDGNWDYLNNKGEIVSMFEDAEYYSDEYDVYIGDSERLEEDCDDIIAPMLPSKPGVYHISGKAHMIYNVSNILMYDEEDYDDLYIEKDYAEIEFSKKESYISDFKISV